MRDDEVTSNSQIPPVTGAAEIGKASFNFTRAITPIHNLATLRLVHPKPTNIQMTLSQLMMRPHTLAQQHKRWIALQKLLTAHAMSKRRQGEQKKSQNENKPEIADAMD